MGSVRITKMDYRLLSQHTHIRNGQINLIFGLGIYKVNFQNLATKYQ